MSHHKHHNHPVDDVNSAPNNNLQPEATEQPIVGSESVTPPVVESTPQPLVGAQPVVTAQQSAMGLVPKKKKKVGLIVGIIAAAVVVLGAVAAVLVYFLWYQNPEKVVFDAVSNAIKAKSVKVTGEFNLKVLSDDSSSFFSVKSAKLTLTEKGNIATSDIGVKLSVTLDKLSKPLTLEGGAILTSNGDVYVRLSGVKSVIDSYVEYAQEESDAPIPAAAIDAFYDQLEPLIKTVDGQWWKISTEELAEASESYAEQKECLTKVAKQLESDDSMRQEIADLYNENRIIEIKDELGVKDGSYGFEIEGDAKAAVRFAKGLKKTKAYKALNKCDSSFTIDDDAIDEANFETDDSKTTKVSVELWVSQYGHEITEIKASVSDKDAAKVDASIKPVFNEDSEVKAPANSKSIKVLIEEIQDFIEGMYSYDYDDDEEPSTGNLTQSQRDTQRKNDVAIISTGVVTYQANNRGKLPEPTTISLDNIGDGFGKYVEGYLDKSQISIISIIDGSKATSATSSGATTSKVVVATGAQCDTSTTSGKYIKSSSSNDFAAIVGLEAGGYYCENS